MGRAEPSGNFDEVRVSLRAASPAEIMDWATIDKAAQSPHGEACHPFGLPVLLDGTSGGPPALGNTGYELTVYGLPGSAVVLGLGSNNQSFGGLPLPLDLGIASAALSGCFLRTSADIALLSGVIGPTGSLDFPIPIPPLPFLEGVVIYSQAVLNSQILGTDMLTNAYATAIGN